MATVYQWTDASRTAIREVNTSERVITLKEFKAQLDFIDARLAEVVVPTNSELRDTVQSILDSSVVPSEGKDAIMDAILGQTSAQETKDILEAQRKRLTDFRTHVLSVIQDPGGI